jgi:hypothetical protein
MDKWFARLYMLFAGLEFMLFAAIWYTTGFDPLALLNAMVWVIVAIQAYEILWLREERDAAH